MRREHDIDWASVAGAVVWTPRELRRPMLDESRALRVLRCTPASFARLRDLGLEPVQTEAGPRYDLCDVRNAAMYSLSGRTEVETVMGVVLSFLHGSDDDLFTDHHWTYELSAAATADGAPGCLLHPPRPESFGGESVAMTIAGADPIWTDGRVGAPFRVPLRGSMVTRGRARRLREPRLLELSRDLLDSGVSWHNLVPGLKSDPHRALRLGIGDCDTLSMLLAERFRQGGHPARVFLGWLIGITTVRHSWVEVVDGDGEVAIVDPSLHLLARHATIGSPVFAGRPLSTVVNRMAPTRCELGDPLGVSSLGQACEIQFFCRQTRGSVR